jgi:hypothetical protein
VKWPGPIRKSVHLLVVARLLAAQFIDRFRDLLERLEPERVTICQQCVGALHGDPRRVIAVLLDEQVGRAPDVEGGYLD